MPDRFSPSWKAKVKYLYDFMIHGAMVKKSADQTTADYTTATALTFNAETYDNGGWHSTSADTSRLTVPTGVTYVEVGGCVNITSTTGDTWKQLEIRKNGSADYDGYIGQSVEVGMTAVSINIQSGALQVTAGDYFELVLQEESDNSVTIESEFTHFWIRALAGH